MKRKSYLSHFDDGEKERIFPSTNYGAFAAITTTGWLYTSRHLDQIGWPAQTAESTWTSLSTTAPEAGSTADAFAFPAQPGIVSQGDRAMGTDLARAQYGFDGSGIKVGVISDSFDKYGAFASDRASGELPWDTRILREGEWGNDEGRAMAQIIHDVAPGASILFAAGGRTMADMAQAIRDLAAAGAKVIVDDLFYQAEPTYQDSIINQAISDVSAQGVTYVTIAGNHGTRAYGAAFEAMANPTVIDGRTVLLHEFAPGQDYIAINIPAWTNIPFTFQWSDSYKSISPSNGARSDLDLFFFNDRNEFLFKVSNPNIGGDPIEQIAYLTRNVGETIHVKVGLVEGPPPDEFRLIALSNGRPVYFEALASNLNSGTLYGHAAARDALSVGAVNYRDTPAFGASQPWAELFSSGGPASFTHDVDGHRLPQPDIRPGPAFMAPNDGDNTFFGRDSDGNGRPNFSGTSAAAPHVAALVALMLQANPALTPVDVRNLLQNSAIDMDDLGSPGFDKGYDSATGAGLIQGTALGFAATGVVDNPLRKSLLLGTHLDDRIIGWGAREEIAGANKVPPAGTSIDVTLYGYAGHDRLEGGPGNDLLDGGSGHDRMSGGAGNDRYVVDDIADLVVEEAGGGTDTVLASISYALPSHVENLTLTGAAALSAFGNMQDNVLIGNEAANLIVGNGGNDALVGGGGDDNLIGGEGADRIFGGTGNDQIHANGGNNRIDAGAGNDLITAGNGDDVIIGGADEDIIYANGGRNLFQLGGIPGEATDGNDQIWAGVGADTYALFFATAEGEAASFGHDTINGFRLAEGDQLLLFNETAGYWDDASTLSTLIEAGQVRGTRSADGGDLTLTFSEGAALPSSLTLKWFYWDNARYLSDDERSTAFGAEIRSADLTGLLLDAVQDGSSVGISGPDYLTAAHHFVVSGYALL